VAAVLAVNAGGAAAVGGVDNDPTNLIPDNGEVWLTHIFSRFVRLAFTPGASTNGTYTAILHMK
jgi:hypothetical protein